MNWLSSPSAKEDLDILARTIFGEARGELYGGKVAIGCVIMNRVNAKTWFGTGVVSVCLSPGQFSCWNANDPNREKVLAASIDKDAFLECLDVAKRTLAGEFEDLTFGSRHYLAPGANPYWAKGKEPIIQIGNHRYFNNIS